MRAMSRGMARHRRGDLRLRRGSESDGRGGAVRLGAVWGDDGRDLLFVRGYPAGACRRARWCGSSSHAYRQEITTGRMCARPSDRPQGVRRVALESPLRRGSAPGRRFRGIGGGDHLGDGVVLGGR
jgi:hypothetical protein